MNTDEMLQALSTSDNGTCKRIAERIISGKSTIADERKYTGRFMSAVLDGNLADALTNCDQLNFRALYYHLCLKCTPTNDIKNLFIARGEQLGYHNLLFYYSMKPGRERMN